MPSAFSYVIPPYNNGKHTAKNDFSSTFFGWRSVCAKVVILSLSKNLSVLWAAVALW
jgi:hypothetical protein